jgi:thiamine biosynthesis lipoprotein
MPVVSEENPESARRRCQPRQAGAMTRRSFVRLAGAAGLGIAAGLHRAPTSETVRHDRQLVRVAETRTTMATFVSIIALDPSRARAQDAVAAAHEEVERLARLLGRFDRATPVALLNREGRIDDPPAPLVEVITSALRHFHRSAGAFDITIQPVIDLFREHHAGGTLPSGAAVGRALARVGSREIAVQRRRIRFRRPGMGVTLDGIAKGYIVDRASAVLSRHGVENHLINAGGDIRTRGRGRRGGPWRVAVQDPDKGGDCPAVIRLTDGAVATSGGYEVYFDREKLLHHILSPATGLSPVASASVSVLARTAMEADALSTAVFVMAPRRGTRFIDSLPSCECMVLDRESGRHLSRGWPGAVL